MWQTRKTGLPRIGLIALCLAPAITAFAWQSRLIWAGKSGGLTFRWTSADIQVRKASGKTLYSVRKQVRAEFRQEKPEDRPDQYEVTLKVLSVVGPVLSYEREDYRNRMSAAHPSFTFAFVSVDGRRPQKPLTLTDLFPDADVCKALLADKIVKEVLMQAGVESTPKTSAELAKLLDGRVFGTGPTYVFSADLLKHFAFHHIEGDKVAVRLLVRGAGGPSHSSSTQLGLLLPIPARLNRALRQAAAKTQGFLMQDSKTVARGAETKIILTSQSSRPPAAVGQKQMEPAPKPASQESVRQIEGYKSWRRVNPKAVLMQPAPAWQCAMPYPSQQPSPHLKKYIFVYINRIGNDAMIRQRQPRFPVGSVIVKEKLAGPDSKAPELLTAMVKRKKGYHPAGGDWEYLVYDGTGTRVQAQGKLDKCQSCHRQEPALETDYVFRDPYLPQKLKERLK